MKCCVCSLEHKLQELLKKTPTGKRQSEESIGAACNSIQTGAYCKKWSSSCSHPECTLYAHQIRVRSDSFIFKRTEFAGLNCFQIAHHPLTSGLWSCNMAHKEWLTASIHEDSGDTVVNDDSDNDSCDNDCNEDIVTQEPPHKKKKQPIPRAYNVRTSHALYTHLRQQYGMQPISRVKNRNIS